MTSDQNQPDPSLWMLATNVVDRAIRAATYPVDDDGLPAEEGQREAYDNAIQAQHDAYLAAELGEVLASGGATAEPVVASSGNQGASVSFDSSEGIAARARLMNRGLAPYAHAHLDQAGLLGGMPGVRR